MMAKADVSGQHKGLLIINGLCLAAVLVLSLLTDSNGRIAGLDEIPSLIVAVVVFATAICNAVVLAVRGRGWLRVLGVVLTIFYALMILPAVI